MLNLEAPRDSAQAALKVITTNQLRNGQSLSIHHNWLGKFLVGQKKNNICLDCFRPLQTMYRKLIKKYLF